MGRKPRPVALTPEEIKFQLASWIERNLTIVERHGPEWVTICPSCGRSKMAVHIGRKAFQCLSANCRFKGWRPTKLVAVTLDISTQQAGEIIAAFGLGITLGPVQKLQVAEEYVRRGPLPRATLPPVDWTLRPAQRDYCRSRGISDEHMRYFGLGSIVSDGTRSKADYALSGRVIFPIWGRSGMMVWWVARAIHDSRAKTINMPRSCREEGHHPACMCYHDDWGLPPVSHSATADEVVLGLHLVKPGERIIIVEGPVDAAVCGPGFVATMRAWISPQQAALIAASGASEAIILFDGDIAGEKGAAQSLAVLSAALPTRIAACPPGADPGSLGRSHALQLADQAPAGGIQQLRDRRYIRVAQPKLRHPLQGPLNHMNGPPKLK